ncbi:MAG: outer membrane protein assembly factor BamA [Alphaproteobacteria bacterium HGW-Alphaproteobacteria-1]|nr:MAG: outer membrane protein assembly factor BamA [Alphaproteobacteria bacterium HGW-Alphaproteobacteria-1]
MALLVSVALFGAAAPAQAQDFRFTEVSIEGNQRIEGDTILSFAGIERGETVSAGQLNDASQRILASGLFETVEVEPRGNRLVIKVTEFPTINRIAFEGNNKIKDENLSGFIQSRSRQVFSPTLAERDAATISEAYSQNGRVAARVTPKVIRRSDNRVDLVFEIFEGRGIEIERIGFSGNREFSDRRLRRVLQSKQTGLLRAFIQRDSFVEDRVNFDRQVLTDFYNSRGFVDFRVTGVNAELARERDAYFLTFTVQEGQQFSFGQITTVSEYAGVEAEVYHDTLKIRPGVVYSPTLVENSITRMELLAVKNGVDFLRIEPRITRNDRDLTLDVEFVLQRGPRVFVVNAREGTRPDQVIIKADVEETTTGSVSVGASFSTDNGLGLQFGFSERNFLGRGQQLTFNIFGTADNVNYNIGFVEPAFLGRNVALGLDFAFQETNSDNSLFDTATGIFRPSLTFPTGENTRFGVFYNLSYNDMSDYNGTSGILQSEVNQGALWTSSVGYEFTFDTRRKGLNPKAGVLLSFGQEFAGLGGDNEFIGGAIHFNSGQNSRFINRFSNPVIRGFESNGLGPAEITPGGSTEQLGGDFFAALKFEAEFPLGLPSEFGITGGAFYDIGSIWGIDNKGSVAPGNTLASSGFEPRHVIGLSLFWDSPFGPIRMDFSNVLKSESSDVEQSFNLSARTNF